MDYLQRRIQDSMLGGGGGGAQYFSIMYSHASAEGANAC